MWSAPPPPTTQRSLPPPCGVAPPQAPLFHHLHAVVAEAATMWRTRFHCLPPPRSVSGAPLFATCTAVSPPHLDPWKVQRVKVPDPPHALVWCGVWRVAWWGGVATGPALPMCRSGGAALPRPGGG